MFEKLEETLDLMPAIESTKGQEIIPVHENDVSEQNAQDDADKELARQTFKGMIRKSEYLLDSLIQIAESTEHPRAFEVAANLVRTIADVAGKLEDSAKKKEKPVQQTSPSPGGQHINNNLFVGSSEDLIKLIRSKRDS